MRRTQERTEERRNPDQDRALERTFASGKALDVLPGKDRRHHDTVNEETRRHEAAVSAADRQLAPLAEPAPAATGAPLDATKGFTAWGPRKLSE